MDGEFEQFSRNFVWALRTTIANLRVIPLTFIQYFLYKLWDRSFTPYEQCNFTRFVLWPSLGYLWLWHEKLSSIVWTPIWSVTLQFRDLCGAASLCCRKRAEITVLMCEQKPYSVWFSCRRKSCPLDGVNRGGWGVGATWWGRAARFSNLTLFQTEKFNFPHPFSNLALRQKLCYRNLD